MLKEEVEETTPRDADNPYTFAADSGSNDVAKEPSQRLAIEEKLASKMFSYAREIICFFLAITFTALAALHSSPPKVSKPPVAKPFFNQSSVVLDFYKGHLGAMIERVTEADFSFVMYYAPWDAESQAVREEFEKVARYYQTEVFFAAINCWHPSSECRSLYNKIQSYPVLMLYPSRDLAIQYRGVRTSPYMISFLHSVMNPIVRITDAEQWRDLLVTYDAVVVGYFNFTRLDRTPGYREFYKAAIRALERDPNRELVFAIVSNALSSEKENNFHKFPTANLIMWNESLWYPEDSEWTSETLLNWISNLIHQPALWLQPPGVKALTLAPYLKDGPVLFLFTPRNPFHLENYNYNLIREIGLQYYNCMDNILPKEIIKRLQINRLTAIARHSEKTQQCIKILKENKKQSNERTISVSIQRWINDSCCANIVMNKCSLCKRNLFSNTKTETSVCKLVSDKLNHACRSVDIFQVASMQDSQEKYEVCCDKNFVAMKVEEEPRFKRYKTSLTKANENDSQSPSAIRQAFIKQDCRRWLIGNRYHHPIFPKESTEILNINLTESVCKINRTLALIAIDSLHYFHFAEGLGIDVSKRKDKTAVVILDAAHESQYVMQEDFNHYALIEFINNYTRGFLQRSLRSNNSRRFAKKFKSKRSCETEGGSICIPELTTENFSETILDPTKDVVVMYHSPYCAFCSAISYVYLTVAHYLREMDHLLFVRVDGDNNDLPWEYNMNRFPSILFFPAKRKEDSTVFPFSLPITIPNLLNFILANLDGDSHIEALTNICESGSEEPDACIARTRWLCLDIIHQLLRDYRKLLRRISFLGRKIAKTRKKSILMKLAHVKDVHLILGTTIDLREDRRKVKLIRKKFRNYYRSVRLIDLDSKMNEDSAPRSDEKTVKSEL